MSEGALGLVSAQMRASGRMDEKRTCFQEVMGLDLCLKTADAGRGSQRVLALGRRQPGDTGSADTLGEKSSVCT